MVRVMKTIRNKRPCENMIVYTRPNMSNLRGKTGKNIIDTIKNTAPADNTESRRIVEDCKELILRMRAQDSEQANK